MSEDFDSKKTDYVFSLDIPQREGKEGFIGTHFTLMLQMGNIISKMEGSTDNRLHWAISLLISLVPDKKIRDSIRKEMKDEIERRVKGTTTNEERGRIINEVSIETVGSVMDFLDKHVGVSRENKVGFSIPKREEKS